MQKSISSEAPLLRRKNVVSSFQFLQFILLFLAVWWPLRVNAVSPDPEEELLQTLFYEEQFGYVLFGAKAMASTTFWERSRWINVHSCRPYPLNAKAFDLWKKISHKYSSRYFFFKEEHKNSRTKIPVHNLDFVNVAKFLEVVNDNIDLFQKVLGKECTAEKLLNEFKTSTCSVSEIVNHHVALIGILLGYGRKNSLFFEFRDQCWKELEQPIQVPFQQKKKQFLAKNFGTKREAFQWIVKSMKSFCMWGEQGLPELYFLRPPEFAVRESKETKALRRYYKNAYAEIASKFSENNILDVISEQLKANKPLAVSIQDCRIIQPRSN